TDVCTATGCGIGACDPGFADCDGIASNGCETNTGTDRDHCGSCTRRCALGQVCTGGTCGIVCLPPTELCGAVCTDTSSDANNCGTCGLMCPTGMHAVAFCASRACGLACQVGFDDCDGITGNGCETSTATDPNNCGMCGTRCIFPHS